MYKTGIIYEIYCILDNSFCYIGSTISSLSMRFIKHKNDYKAKRDNFSIHKYFDKYGFENFRIIEIKKYLVCDEKHLKAYELLHITNNKKCINSMKPFNPLKKVDQKISVINYHKKNKILINEKRSQKITCECGSIVVKNQIARHKKTKKHIKFMEKNKK